TRPLPSPGSSLEKELALHGPGEGTFLVAPQPRDAGGRLNGDQARLGARNPFLRAPPKYPQPMSFPPPPRPKGEGWGAVFGQICQKAPLFKGFPPLTPLLTFHS